MPLLRRQTTFITTLRRYSARVPWTRATLAAFLLLAVPAAGATKKPSIYESKLLWATINYCDSAKHPDTIGIRASMPGSGVKSERMFIRFQVQYYLAAKNEWHNIGDTGDSGFIDVGRATFKARRTGRDFVIKPPTSGSWILRGAVTYEWRKGGEVVRRARKRTRSGHPTSAGADPKGFSAAKCEIKK
jgi:hypothetical protein